MRRLLILDGLTATGKTTTANYLSETFNFRIIKFPPEKIIKNRIKEMKSDIYSECKLYIDDLMLFLKEEVNKIENDDDNSGEVIIFDRSFLSTLTFQAKTKELQDYIIAEYKKAFIDCKIDLINSLTLFFNTRIDGVERVQKISEKYLLEQENNIEERFEFYAKNYRLDTDLIYMNMNKTKVESLKDFIIMYFKLDFYK